MARHDVPHQRRGAAQHRFGHELALVRRDAPRLPIAVIPQLGALAPHEPQHVPHEGLAIGYVGRLVPQKGLDILFQALARQRGAKWRLTIVGGTTGAASLAKLPDDLLPYRPLVTSDVSPKALEGLVGPIATTVLSFVRFETD